MAGGIHHLDVDFHRPGASAYAPAGHLSTSVQHAHAVKLSHNGCEGLGGCHGCHCCLHKGNFQAWGIMGSERYLQRPAARAIALCAQLLPGHQVQAVKLSPDDYRGPGGCALCVCVLQTRLL